MSYSASSYDVSKFQPKFKDCTFESDKKPESFRTWTRLLSGIVRNIKGGREIEQFLDNYLQRNVSECTTRPAFLSNPALRLGRLGQPPAGNVPPRSPSGHNSSAANASFAASELDDDDDDAENPGNVPEG